MRKVAAHRVFLASKNAWLSMCVVEIDDSGIVRRCSPLHEEQRATEWLGGVIIIASKRPERHQEESFADFCNRLHLEESASEESASPEAGIQAYHITGFAVAGMQFTPASRVVGL